MVMFVADYHCKSTIENIPPLLASWHDLYVSPHVKTVMVNTYYYTVVPINTHCSVVTASVHNLWGAGMFACMVTQSNKHNIMLAPLPLHTYPVANHNIIT